MVAFVCIYIIDFAFTRISKHAIIAEKYNGLVKLDKKRA